MALPMRSLTSLSHTLRSTYSRSSHLRAMATLTQLQPRSRPPHSRFLLYASTAATACGLATSPRTFAEYSVMASPAPPKGLPDITLYQYDVCPFCNKVRAYLDFNNIPYKIIEVDPLRKTELKAFTEDYRKVPIALVNGEQINGSDKVIDHIHKLTKGKQTPVSPEEKKWLTWLEDYFIHLIAPNIYRTPSESLQTFEYIANNSKFSPWQRSTIRYTGAVAMYFVGRKIKKKYGIEDERKAIHSALHDWSEAIAQAGTPFLAGPEPGVADLSIFGVLKSLRTFDTFREIREKNIGLAAWYDRTSEAVGEACVTERQ